MRTVFVMFVFFLCVGCVVDPSSEYVLLLSKKQQHQMWGDIDNFHILQNGRIVGHIYVPVRDKTALSYDEHWVLLPSYVYPGTPGYKHLKTVIIQSDISHVTKEEFFEKVPFPRVRNTYS